MCYTYWSGGILCECTVQYSVKANADGLPFMGYWDNQGCGLRDPDLFANFRDPHGCVGSPDGRVG